MGTNRRGIEFTFQEFLCTPKTKWSDPGITDYYVRRDVSRTPPQTFETLCRNCHAPMDALGGALARWDYINDTLTFYPNSIAPKYNQNTNFYPDGYVTVNDNWVNYFIYHQNQAFGWRGNLSGVGINDFGTMMANSRGFSSCMVQKVFQEVCNRPLAPEEKTLQDSLTDSFEQGKYNLKTLFAQVATQDACLPHPTTKGRK